MDKRGSRFIEIQDQLKLMRVKLRLIQAQHGIVGRVFGNHASIAICTAAMVVLVLTLAIALTAFMNPERLRDTASIVAPLFTLMVGVLLGRMIST